MNGHCKLCPFSASFETDEILYVLSFVNLTSMPVSRLFQLTVNSLQDSKFRVLQDKNEAYVYSSYLMLGCILFFYVNAPFDSCQTQGCSLPYSCCDFHFCSLEVIRLVPQEQNGLMTQFTALEGPQNSQQQPTLLLGLKVSAAHFANRCGIIRKSLLFLFPPHEIKPAFSHGEEWVSDNHSCAYYP